MRADSVEQLKALFADWRRKKQHTRERVPERLVARARRAAVVHGAGAVVQATALDYRRLSRGATSKIKRAGHRAAKRAGKTDVRGTSTVGQVASRKNTVPHVPPYSRVALHTPETLAQPLVEVEMPAGMKVRIFQVTAETVSLLSVLSNTGRVP